MISVSASDLIYNTHKHCDYYATLQPDQILTTHKLCRTINVNVYITHTILKDGHDWQFPNNIHSLITISKEKI